MQVAQVPPTTVTNQRRSLWIFLSLAVIVAVHVGLAWEVRQPGILTGQDDAEYISLAQSLGSGTYQEPWRIDAPWHSTYPPGYPAMLALWAALIGNSFNEFVALTVVLSGLTLAMAFAVLRLCLDIRIAYASVIILAVNPSMVRYGGMIASEIPYTFLTMVCFYALMRTKGAQYLPQAQREMEIDKSTLAWLMIAALAAIASALTRTVGVTLVGALILYLLLDRRWRTTVYVMFASILTIGAWIAWTLMAEEQFIGRSYIADLGYGFGGGDSWLMTLLKRIWSNALYYPTRAVPSNLAIPSIRGVAIDNAVSVAVLASMMLVGLSVFMRRWRSATLYLLAYAALLLAWKWHLDRYLVPVLVVLVPLTLAGGVALANGLLPRFQNLDRAVIVTLVIALAGSGAIGSLDLVRASAPCHPTGAMPGDECLTRDQASYFAALRFIDRNLPKEAVFMTVKTGALFYYTGHRSISVEASLTQDKSAFIPFLRQQGAQYILLAAVDDGAKRLPYRLEANCELVEIIQSFTPGTLLFRIMQDSGRDRVTDTVANGCEAIRAYWVNAEPNQ